MSVSNFTYLKDPTRLGSEIFLGRKFPVSNKNPIFFSLETFFSWFSLFFPWIKCGKNFFFKLRKANFSNLKCYSQGPKAWFYFITYWIFCPVIFLECQKKYFTVTVMYFVILNKVSFLISGVRTIPDTMSHLRSKSGHHTGGYSWHHRVWWNRQTILSDVT